MRVFHYSFLLLSCLLSLQILIAQAQGSNISFTPNTDLCLGDEIEMVCFVETSEAFALMTAFVSINSSNPFSLAELMGDTVEDNIDLSQYTASIDGLTITTNRPGIRVIIRSYQTSDSATLFGCHGFFSNTTLSSALVSQQAPSDLAAPPSSPSLSTSLSTLSASECQGVSVSWLAPATDRAITQYYLYRNSSLISTLSNTTTQYTDTDPLTLNAAYLYSLAAASCAGNSTMGSATAVITGYELMMSTNSLCLSYSNVSNMVTLYWNFSAPTPTTTLLIEYSLTLNYSHTQGNETRTFSDSTSFSLLSSDARTSTQSLTPHSFVGGVEVETNITAVLRITQQCGQSYSGTQISCSISSIYLPPPDNTEQISTFTQSSSVSSASSMHIPMLPTSTPTPTPTPATATSNIGLIAGVIGGLAGFLIILVTVVVLLGLCVCFLKNRDKDIKDPDTINIGNFGGNQSRESIDRQPEATYSQVNKPSKPEQPLYADIKKPQKELLYADLEHVAPGSGMVKPPTVPSTHYADLAQFSHSEQTTYATVQDTKY